MLVGRIAEVYVDKKTNEGGGRTAELARCLSRVVGGQGGIVLLLFNRFVSVSQIIYASSRDRCLVSRALILMLMYHSGSSYGVVRSAEKGLEVERLDRRGGTSFFISLRHTSTVSNLSNHLSCVR